MRPATDSAAAMTNAVAESVSAGGVGMRVGHLLLLLGFAAEWEFRGLMGEPMLYK